MFAKKDIGKVFYMPLVASLAGKSAEVNLKSSYVFDTEGNIKSAFVATDGSEDRHREIVNPDGWDLKFFKQNPVMLWAHNHAIPAIGTWDKIRFEGKGNDKKLLMEPIFDVDDKFASLIAKKVDSGFIRMVSVGFIPLELDGDYNSIKQELIETSIVNIGANRNALNQNVVSAETQKAEVKAISETMLDYLLSK